MGVLSAFTATIKSSIICVVGVRSWAASVGRILNPNNWSYPLILVDYKKGGDKQKPTIPEQLVSLINRLGVPAELSDLQYGDFCFEGKGPDGPMLIGIERKTLHDLLTCIVDARFAGHQSIGMKRMYGVSVLLVEGHYKPHEPLGVLMEGYNGGTSWGYCKHRSRATYDEIHRYLISVQLMGVLLDRSRDLFGTAYNVVSTFKYFQKAWDDHLSGREIHRIAIPTMGLKPSLVRKWANDLEGIGTKMSELAERQFRTPLRLAQGDESDWMRIPGVGVATAQDIVRQIWGMRRGRKV